MVVTADKDIYRSDVDRRSYGISAVRADGGSLAEALQKLPGLQVDLQGNVSIRGDSSVTILVDGKPSGTFQGEGRANALLQVSADEFERVEVMTIPSAVNAPEGSGGVINLVRKKKKAQKQRTLAVRANLGTEERYNGSIRGAFNGPEFWGSATIGGRRDTGRLVPSSERRLPDPQSGATSSSRVAMKGRTVNTAWNGQGNLGYEFTPGTSIFTDAAYTKFDYHSPFTGAYRAFGASSAPGGAYDVSGRSSGRLTNTSVSVDFDRKLSGEGHKLSVRLGHVRTTRGAASTQAISYLAPGASGRFTMLASTVDKDETNLSVDYKRSLDKGTKLVLGLDLRDLDDDQDHLGSLGVTSADAKPSPLLANAFGFSRTTTAAYGSYQRSFGKLNLFPAVRLEYADRSLVQRTLGSRSDASNFRVYPSLNLTFAAKDEWKVRAGYTRRVQRPEAQDLNPFRVYVSPLSYQQGNPNLRDQVTDAVELGLEHQRGGDLYSATLFARQRRNELTDVVTDLGNGVLLTSRDGLGRSRYAGVELVLSRKLARNLSFNGSGEVSRSEIEYVDLARRDSRSGWIVSGRANLDWRITDKDFLQVNLTARGASLMAQGHRLPSANLNLGYRRKLSSKLAVVAVVQDVFDTYQEGYTLASPRFSQRVEQNLKIRSAVVGLTYALGGGKQGAEKFDYGSAGQ